MDLGSPKSPLVTSPATSSKDETRRVKFLCSFLGNILPRPQDGKLRYVGGETRIVCLPRDIKYEQLMSKMRELYEEVTVLKYQQPDEDLDALVSIINDDDVTNMMEEYDKLGSGDGFTRLRLFLFSSSDQDGSSHYVDVDEWDAEQRYMDGLNNFNNAFDIWSLQQHESSHRTSVDDYSVEPTLSTLGTESDGLSGRCSTEIAVPKGNLHNLRIPRVGSGPIQHRSAQRYGEKDGSWSPYLSPRLERRHDPRTFPEFPNSPSSTRCCMPYREFLDKLPEECYRQQASYFPGYEHQPLVPESAVWVPATAVSANSKGGFPGNVLHGSGFCESCQLNFHRNQQYVDPPYSGNVFTSPFAECPPNKEKTMLTADSEFHQGSYLNEPFRHEIGRLTQHQLNQSSSWTFHNMTQVPSVGRPVDHFIIDGPTMNYPNGHGNLVDGHHFSSGYVQLRDDTELPNDGFHVQSLAGGPPYHQFPSVENHGLSLANHPHPRGADDLRPVSQAYLQPRQNLWRNAPNYVIDLAFVRAPVETDGMPVGAENHSPRVNSSGKSFGYDSTAMFKPHIRDDLCPDPSDPTQVSSADFEVQSQTPDPFSARQMLDRVVGNTAYVTERVRSEGGEIVQDDKTSNLEGAAILESSELASDDSVIKPEENLASNPDETLKPPVDCLSYLPKCIASAEKTTPEGTEMLKYGKNTDAVKLVLVASGADLHKSEQVSQMDIEADADGDNTIEPTKAEAEAIARGLQTIKNDDLEEIRELGSGTYGAVYHGKWKGSDVAIKRIKASCFSGRSSERERLIADFWKEALILSSLHHPNVVSFYGIVRDGLGGSLATVTEYMVNGSLKQFLQKKDRTIDRRKRLIIAMDAAFGMEYLHEKKVVHFDLKCENLLVNMRDPQRPVCKIGDLGLSKVKQQTLVSGGVRGTLPWIAPELLSGKSNMVTEKIDVYSFGIVMWELLTGEEPYADMKYASIIGGILNNTLRPKVPQRCDPEWKALMEGCWVSDPAERPSFSEISQRLRNMAAAMNVK